MAEKQFWLFSGWCKQSGRGRDAWPARMLMAMLVLRFSEEGMSRRAAVSRARVDMGWRAAMGLPMGGASRSETTVRRFEAFMMQRDPRTGTTRFLLMHEPVVRLSLQDAGLRSRAVWATDSTPMWCYGAGRDTVRLLGDGLRWLGGLYARITGETLGELAATWGVPLLLSKSVKGHYAIDWSSEHQRADVIEQLAGDVVRVVDWVRASWGHGVRWSGVEARGVREHGHSCARTAAAHGGASRAPGAQGLCHRLGCDDGRVSGGPSRRAAALQLGQRARGQGADFRVGQAELRRVFQEAGLRGRPGGPGAVAASL